MKQQTVKMKALMSRPQNAGRRAIKRGDIYETDAQGAIDDEARGFGERVPEKATSKAGQSEIV